MTARYECNLCYELVNEFGRSVGFSGDGGIILSTILGSNDAHLCSKCLYALKCELPKQSIEKPSF